MHQRRREAALVLRRRDASWVAEGDTQCRVGDAAHDGPESLFAAWHWDGERLTVANDRYGMVPIYVSAAPGSLILSTSLLGAVQAGAPNDLDYDAMAVLQRLGYCLGNDTPLRAIRRLPPGAVAVMDGDSIRVRGEPCIPAPRDIARDEALVAFAELLRSAVARRLPETANEPFLLPLSGGRDSRHILYALLEAGAPPSAVVTVRHIPPKADEDVRVAGILANELGLAHSVLQRSERRLEDELRKNRLTQFEAPQTHAWAMPLVDHLADYAGPLFDGFGGDTLSMARYLDPEDLRLYEVGDLSALAERVLGDEAPAAAMLDRDAYHQMPRERAVERVVRELAQFAGAANPVRSFRFWSYSRRLIGASPFGLLGDLKVRLPYLDHAVHDLLAALPPRVVMADGGHFHTAAISRAYPQFDHIPYENKALPPVEDTSYHRRAARETLRYLARNRAAGDLHNAGFVFPRLLRCLVDPRYSSAAGWIVPRAVYNVQLRKALLA